MFYALRRAAAARIDPPLSRLFAKLIFVGILVIAAGATASAAEGPSLDDFWNGRANFEFVRMWQSPSNDKPSYGDVLYNQQAYVVPLGNVWYSFSREAISPLSKDADAQRPAYCKFGYARFVLHSSTDAGATWTDRRVLIEPTPGTFWECAAVDGTAFFDAPTTTWHLVFQCLARTGPWSICHATRHSADPAGPFVIDARPAVTGGSLVKQMRLTPFVDEGTPQIVAKIGDRFYMSFHAYDGVHGIRAMAWTRDFHTWSFDSSKPLFDARNCASWNVPWTGSCIGGGWADMLRSGSFAYMLIEAADKNLGGSCIPGKHWIFGLLRAADLNAAAWQPLPGGPAIIFSLPALPAVRLPCSDSYAQIFRAHGATYLSVFQMPVPQQPQGPATGRYLYVLRRGAPIVSYGLRWGSSAEPYTLSDVISRGNLAARIENARWLNPGLAMNGVNSRIVLPDTPGLKRAAPWSLTLNLTLHTAPAVSVQSAFIAGDLSSAWLELYPDRTLCAWARTAQGPQRACGQLLLDKPEDIVMIATPDRIALSLDGKPPVTTKAESAKAITRLTVGSASIDANGRRSSWNGTLNHVSFFDYALAPGTPASLRP